MWQHSSAEAGVAPTQQPALPSRTPLQALYGPTGSAEAAASSPVPLTHPEQLAPAADFEHVAAGSAQPIIIQMSAQADPAAVPAAPARRAFLSVSSSRSSSMSDVGILLIGSSHTGPTAANQGPSAQDVPGDLSQAAGQPANVSRTVQETSLDLLGQGTSAPASGSGLALLGQEDMLLSPGDSVGELGGRESLRQPDAAGAEEPLPWPGQAPATGEEDAELEAMLRLLITQLEGQEGGFMVLLGPCHVQSSHQVHVPPACRLVQEGLAQSPSLDKEHHLGVTRTSKPGGLPVGCLEKKEDA